MWKVSWLPYPVNGFLTTLMPEDLAQTVVQNLMEEGQHQWDDEVLRDIYNERDIKINQTNPYYAEKQRRHVVFTDG